MRRLTLLVVAMLLVVLTGAGRLKAEYGYGFIWDRSEEYQDGTIQGSSQGNPNLDSMGNAVWSMESTNEAGDGLGGENPWYEGVTTPAVWDASWYGRPFGAWAQGNDACACLLSDYFEHTLRGEWSYKHVPMVRWLNPVDQPFEMEITGEIEVQWNGEMPADVDTDVIIAHLDVSQGTTTLLYSKVFEKPTSDHSVEILVDTVHIPFILIEPGDQLLISGRGHHPASSAYNDICDDLILRYRYPLFSGDANGDGIVNDLDASILATYWQYEGTIEIGWQHGDFNGDGEVTDADASILAAHWQESQEGAAAVPEPSTVVLLALAVVSLLVWQRK